MPKYYFQPLDHAGVRPTEMAYAFDTAEGAFAEARAALSEMAADGLRSTEYDVLSVDVFDENRKPMCEIRLVLEEIDKKSSAISTEET